MNTVRGANRLRQRLQEATQEGASAELIREVGLEMAEAEDQWMRRTGEMAEMRGVRPEELRRYRPFFLRERLSEEGLLGYSMEELVG